MIGSQYRWKHKMDAMHEEIGIKESIEEIRNDVMNDDDLIEDIYQENKEEQESKKVIALYSLEDYYNKNDRWNDLTDDNKFSYCSSLLEIIKSDEFPLQRQVFVLTNLVNLDLNDLNYYEILGKSDEK
ncbi:MAG: hypothetical protein Q9M43_06775 [Sulfurimonas sp.]|nr:hypothetical protein [Sulfurimonas sp.]